MKLHNPLSTHFSVKYSVEKKILLYWFTISPAVSAGSHLGVGFQFGVFLAWGFSWLEL